MKKSFIFIICLLGLMLCCYYKPVFAKPILRLDPGGHVALIWDIKVHPSGRYFISASADKTIRVWRVLTYRDRLIIREQRKILGQIKEGLEGTIYAASISPDGKYLAVGGILNGNNIRIFDFYTGKLLKLLKGHTDSVLDICFSEDGRYLISSGYDKRVIIWDMGSFQKKAEYFHDKEVYTVSSFYMYDDMYVVSGSYDHKVKLFSLKKNSVIKVYVFGNRIMNNSISVSKKYGIIAVAVSYGRKIYFFDLNLNLIKKIRSSTVPLGTALSPSGRFLAVGTMDYPYTCTIYDLATLREVSRFKQHHNLTMALAFLNEHIVISGGGNNNEIRLWSTNTTEGKQLAKSLNSGRVIWAVGINGSKIAWGDELKKSPYLHQNPLRKYFDLKDFRVKLAENNMFFNRISRRWGPYILNHAPGGNYGYKKATLVIKRYGKTVAKITRDATDGYRHNSYGFTEEGFIVSGGSNGDLWAYDVNGRKIAKFVGHFADIWSIATQGRWLVSGGHDQRILIWDLKKLREYKGKTLIIYPTLNLFVASNDEWVVWTPNGYFTCSAHGGGLIGWHVNRGYGKEALWYSADKFYRLFYNPRFINSVYKYGSEEIAKKYVSIKERKISEVLPPMIEVLNPVRKEITTYNKKLNIQFCVKQQSDLGIEEVKLLVNGANFLPRSIGVKKLKNKKCFSKVIPLIAGKNLISITARNRYARSNTVTISVLRKSKQRVVFLPDVYLLVLGVSRYKNSDYNLKFADKDAIAIKDTFKEMEGKLFRKVHAKVLINEECTKENVLDGLDWLESESTQHDLVIIFVGGHGINDDRGNYYFLTHEADIKRLRRTCIKWREFEDLISGLNCKVLFFVDTCHSGNIYTARRAISSNILEAIQSLKDTGVGTVIFSATTGKGFSYEDDKLKHGAFTAAVVEGLRKQRADLDGNGQITIKELDLYISRRVKEITGKKQKPTTIIPEAVPDFTIFIK